MKVWSVISQSKSPLLSPLEIIWAIFIGIPLGFIVSWIINYKFLHKFAEFIKMSTKYGDENLYSYYLNTNEVDWVYIRDKEKDLIYQGRVQSYSENEKIQEIVLTEVTVYSYYDPEKLYETPSVYISRELGKLQIEQIPEVKFNNQNKGDNDG